MHHDLWIIFVGWVLRKVFDAGWNYGKQLVQAVALFYLFVVFVYFFAATSVSPPRPVGRPVAP